MKQRKFGKKVQNWHRPLGRHQFKRRYLRLRSEEPSLPAAVGSRLADNDLREARDWADCWDPWDNYCCYDCWRGDTPLPGLDLNGIANELVMPPSSLAQQLLRLELFPTPLPDQVDEPELCDRSQPLELQLR